MTKYFFSQLIINWYHKHGRKNLPWQKNKTLYKIWISEIMLQQTQVKFVIPYFQKFMLYFPDINTLNQSTLDNILYVWSGLGYYNRAKNIHRSAKIITKEYNGIFPNQFINVIKLPGIGRSTAGAILSLSLNFHYPILDGNVKRILIRYYGIISSLTDKTTEKKLWNIIESITPIHHTGQFNQGMMDLGSLICTRIKPKCKFCPLNIKCIINIKKEWDHYPIKNTKKIYPKKTSYFIVIRYKNNFWLTKNTKKDIWKNLFCFPKFDDEKKALIWLKEKKININTSQKMISFTHKFSHFILYIQPIFIQLTNILNFHQYNIEGIWYDLKNPQYIGLPQPVQKILDIFKKDNV
ncbi:A/G-specific adenine glycosylase [Buchnera aphidicola]|uniref:Adenine DNA glycosylase n=1 Tax=Buchnera aphidicola str. Ua (Uroleucon ambrosiae) TaxID=1005057 RepID=G2LQ32_BUCUM|nr:A/G-specific adenine glycosylase [Buchnera aphidicola]AEO08319.1 A/G-specific adenine glycosylase [Buchnera aphidicola str. Ua (Uroleucon ambrosiae)]